MATFSERASDFWARISPRERVLVLLAGVAVPLTLTIWLGLAIRDGLDAKAAHNEKMRKALVTLADLKARGSMQPVDDPTKDMGVEPLSLDTYLSKAAGKAGFQLKSTQPRTPVTKNGFVTTSVSLSLSDLTIDQLEKFLQEVETASKFVAVTHLDIRRRDYKGHDKLDAQLEVSTYSKEPPPKGEGGGSAGSAGSADKKGG
jgi:type II secretory pathway component PulM